MATSRVARTNKKIYFIPAGLAVVAAVLVAILMGGKDEKPAKIAASAAPAEQPAQLALEAAKQVPPPSVTPIAEPAPAVPAAIVTPIEPAAAPAAATGELPNDAVAPPEVVPASAFVAGGATVETVPTVPAGLAKTETAPAPEAVAETAPEKAEKAPKAKTKSRRELAREKRAAKRAGKRTTKRETKQVARAEPAEKAGKLNGNGALAVSSSQPREVWVDGRNSKRMTPLRVLLKPGKHKVTLFDKEHGTAKTFEVDIKPDTTTKVSK